MHPGRIPTRKFVTVLAVTRSGRQYVAEKAHEDRTMKDPKIWEAQKQVRQGCLKEIQKLQKDMVQTDVPQKQGEKAPIQEEMIQQSKHVQAKADKSRILTDTMVSLDQILSLVLEFKRQILKQAMEEEIIKQEPDICQVEAEDVDYIVPKVQIHYNAEVIDTALVDGGSGVNILPEFMYKKMNLPVLEEVPFQLKMADQRRIQPLGILRNQEIIVAGLAFSVNFVVLRMDEGDSPYPLLVGRPWLRAAKVKQDWGSQKITIRKGKKKVKVNMIPSVKLPKHARALYAQGINMVEEIEDDEEDAFMQVNESVIPVFEIDVARIVDEYKTKRLKGKAQEEDRKQNKRRNRMKNS